MSRAVSVLAIIIAVAMLALLPGGKTLLAPEPAYAASGATFIAPPNYYFEAEPKHVGDGPTNYDFSDGGTGWTKTGTVTFSGGVATLSGSATLRSSSYTLADDVQSIKVRYKAGATASVSVLMGGSGVGSGDLSCIGCTTGEWVEKYIPVYTVAQGEDVKVRFFQTSGTTEIDWAGTQWIPLQEWRSASTGTKSQPKMDPAHGQFMELHGTMYSDEFILRENRLEFRYAFPESGESTLFAYLYRASDNNILDLDILAVEDSTSWDTYEWTWSGNYVDTAVYVRFTDASTQASWIDDVGVNLAQAASRRGFPSADAGDPFDTTSGQFTHSHTDILIPGKGIPLEFTRSYQSMVPTYGDLGHNWRHTYSTSLRIDDGSITVYYASGGASYFEEDEGDYIPPPGVFDTLEDNGDDTYTLTTDSGLEYNFDDNGKLTSITDRNGNTTTVSYDGNGYISEVEDAGGRTLTFTVDGSGRITEIEDPLERTVGFEYDASGDLVEVTDVKGGTTTYTYDNHRMTSLTDSNDHLQNENIYDGANRVVEQTDALGGITCVYYGSGPSYTSTNCPGASPSPAAGETVVVDPNGNEATYGFDTSFRTTDVEDHLGNSVHLDYDSDNNVTCVTDQRGNKTAYDYDSSGNVTQMIDADNTDANCDLKQGGVDWEFTYTASNDIDLETDPLGRHTDYVYDGSGNLTDIIRKDDQSNVVSRTCFTPDGDGLVTEVIQSTTLTDCTGHTTEFDYDTYGNQIEVIDPRFSGQQDPPVTAMTYDLGGRLLTITNELDETTTYTYDAQNNVLTAEDELGNVTSNTYDAKGNLETVMDANRQPVSTPESGEDCGAAGTGDGVDDDSDTVADDGCPNVIYVYDDGDRLIEVIDALGNSTTYGYDGNGNRTSVTNANRQPVGAPETGTDCGTAGTGDGDDDDSDQVEDDGCPSMLYTYDELNRLESETDSLGHVTSYEYDEASNLIERTDARGLVTAYEYDALNRLVLVEHWDGETLVDDVDYTYDDVGNRLTMVDDTGTTEYEYDALDRPTSVTFPGDDTVAYDYDDLPGGSAADYPGRRTLLTYPDSKDVEYTYDKAGNLETVTDWLDNTTTYVYDDAGRLTDTDLPNGVDAAYTYDGAGRLDTVVNMDATPTTISSFDYTLDAVGNRTAMEDLDGTHSYEYDPLYRLTEVTYPGQEVDAYTYDAVGNRLTKDTDDYTYDAADQLADLESVTYDYDGNGNQTDRGSDTFEYDHENRLVETVIDSVTSTSVYNGDGLRMSHTVDQTTTDYIWDVAAGLPVVLQDGANTYVYGLDLISATDGAGDQTYFTYDGLGSVGNLTDDEGDVIDGYTYDVFGAIRSQSGASDNYWLFTGEQSDSDEGLYYLRARYYDPASGRFLGRDPVPFANRYPYVNNNPVNFIDPSGLASEASPFARSPHFHGIIDRDRLEALFDEYLDCIKFGLSLLAGYGGVWGLMAAIAGTVAAEYVADEGHDPAYAGIAGSGVVGKKFAPTAIEKVIQSQLQARGLRNEANLAIRASGDQLKAFARNYAIWMLRAYSAWGCARSLGIVH